MSTSKYGGRPQAPGARYDALARLEQELHAQYGRNTSFYKLIALAEV